MKVTVRIFEVSPASVFELHNFNQEANHGKAPQNYGCYSQKYPIISTLTCNVQNKISL